MNKLDELKKQFFHGPYISFDDFVKRAYALGQEEASKLDYQEEARKWLEELDKQLLGKLGVDVVAHVLSFARHLSTLTAGEKPVESQCNPCFDGEHDKCVDPRCQCICKARKPTPPVATPAPVEELRYIYPPEAKCLDRHYLERMNGKLNELIRAHNALVARTNEH